METKILSILTQLIKINSVFPNEVKYVEFLLNFFRKLNVKMTKQKVADNRYNIVSEKGKGKKSVALYAHMDTVGVASGWKTDPFYLTRKGDKLIGLGAFDMKGATACAIEAFLSAQPKNFKLKLILCVDEENISEGAYKLVESKLSKDIDCFISLEPAFQYGLRGIVTGRIGRAIFVIKLTRSSLHYAFYDPKSDLGLLSSEIVEELGKLYRVDKKNRKEFVFVRKIQTEAIGMSLPESLTLELDSSVLLPNTNDKLLNRIRGIVKKISHKYSHDIEFSVEFKERKTPFLPAYEVSSKDKYLAYLSNSVNDLMGEKAIPYFRSSVADENAFSLTRKTVLCIGPEGGNAHSANEWVSLSSLVKLQKILSLFLEKVDNHLVK